MKTTKSEFEEALKTIQKYYMQVNNRNECVYFYSTYIQPIKLECDLK